MKTLNLTIIISLQLIFIINFFVVNRRKILHLWLWFTSNLTRKKPLLENVRGGLSMKLTFGSLISDIVNINYDQFSYLLYDILLSFYSYLFLYFELIIKYKRYQVGNYVSIILEFNRVWLQEIFFLFWSLYIYIILEKTVLKYSHKHTTSW